MMDKQYKNWKLEKDSDDILWLIFDRENSPVNTLNTDVVMELDTILGQVDKEKPAGIVIISGKEKGFIAGADISQFSELKTEDQAYDLIRKAQIIFNKLEALDIPTVAMINGFCLGGGTELALACRYRVACDVPSTRIGLPEVRLGIQPGWGGTVRLPPLVGAPTAMDMMLTGRTLSARAAKKVGLVDEAVALRELKRAARYYVLNRPAQQRPSWWLRLTNAAVIRPLLARYLYAQLHKKNILKEHYPAPYAIIHRWVMDGCKGDAMVNEAKSISKLMVTKTARNLVRVFFLSTEMKNLAKDSSFVPKHVHVIGAGTMGGDIAAVCAYKGLHVTLQDQSAERIAPAMGRAAKFYKKKLKKPRLVQAALDRLQPDVEGHGIASADIVIEAIFEDLKVKQDLFKDLESKVKPSAILASNTSSIPLEEIATVLQNPERLVGVHFFNPVAKMPLVEIVKGANTSEAIVKDAAKFTTKISKSPLQVASSPGFLINRILMPYLMEAMLLYQEGVAAEAIDHVAVKFGMPMGPITLADTVGLDICLSVAEKLSGDAPEKLKQMVEAKKLGIKTGEGFYKYHKGKKVKTGRHSDPSNAKDICDRMVLSMVNESVACLNEGVIQDADMLDIGMIFGTGFAPFRGGPLEYAKEFGVQKVKARLDELAEQYGERFKPAKGWEILEEK